MSIATWHYGDVRAVLPTLPASSIDLVCCSPPFWRQRAYLPTDHPDKALEIGQEADPGTFMTTLLGLTAEWRRLLTPFGSIAIELGDTMAGSGGAGGDYYDDGWRAGQPRYDGSAARKHTRATHDPAKGAPIPSRRPMEGESDTKYVRPNGLDGHPAPDLHKGGNPKVDGALPKSHCMIPEAYRFALVWGINPFTGEESPAGRWIVRNVVDWCRRNPTPGDDGDKFRRASTDIVIATLSPRRWWDPLAVREPAGENTHRRTAVGVDAMPRSGKISPDTNRGTFTTINSRQPAKDGPLRPGGAKRITQEVLTTDGTRPLYDWWDLSSDPYPGAHYAVWPPEVARRLIVAMCPMKVCTTCGEPQRRIVETVNSVGHATGSKHWIEDTSGSIRPDVIDRNDDSVPDYAIRETVGWSDCGHGTWRNGRVLDPFAGSGTTGAVATGNGRDADLIDLDARNRALAEDRIGGLFLQDYERPVVDTPPL